MDVKQLKAKYEQMDRKELYDLMSIRNLPMIANLRKSALISTLIDDDIYWHKNKDESLEYWLAFDLN